LAEQAQGTSPLSTVVAGVAEGVALALRGGGGSYALSRVLPPEGAVASAAIRVLGADVLAPYAPEQPYATGSPAVAAPGGPDEALVRAALAAHPPAADATEVSLWSYRGLLEAAQGRLPGDGQNWPPEPAAGLTWVDDDPWPKLAHRASQLAALSVPGLAAPLAGALARRTDDLSRGFVRAVRRRDWLQAAGLGRWLAGLPGVPETLGLDSGLVFVDRMSGGDPRVALQVAAARCFYGRGS
jgi:hypothetical protein